MTDGEWEVLDRKALRAIRLSLVSTVAFNFFREKTTQNLTVAISKMYEKPSASIKIFLMNKLFNLKIAEASLSISMNSTC